MPITFIEAVAISTISGVFGGMIGPIVSNMLTSKWWKFTKNHELKYQSFQSALQAIGKMEADILDVALQNQKESYEGIAPIINFRSETRQCIENSKGLIHTWFSAEVYNAFEGILHTNLSFHNIPNEAHEKAKLDFIIKAAIEVKI
ncbi:MAG: hypothetical protein HUK40_16155 [Desulfobacter sp.]|nr:hypothetical protein [Desulfobacter sp.]WDP87099.1 MAG: hypothetical protein HUN05_19830 [Desulfobacter sp.]